MGSRILAGRYELMEKIGEGGMAVVFKARDRLLNRHVAIKILKPEFTKDLAFIESFRRESQTAAGLVHPHIVNVYDVGKEGNIYYIVMELIEGKPLSEIINKEGALDPKRAATIAKQIASALAVAHKHQLIHRDVKPHNIMITNEGVAKITDFGIAKAMSTGTFVGSQQEAVMGSVHYFSPEQARGGYVDEKSDIYSLGIVLYEMLTGKLPFDGETAVSVAVKHMNETMTLPSKINPDIPADLEEIVLKATNKLQINRYKSADEMITALNFVKYSKSSSTFETESRANASASNAVVAPLNKNGNEEESPFMKNNASKTVNGNGKKKKKVVFHPEKMAIIVLALILAVFASGLIYKAIMGATAPAQLTVPDLAGLTQEAAIDVLTPIGLSLEIDMELPSTIYPEGEIISQAPKAEAVVKPGTTIRVNISKGVIDGTVPSIDGKPLSGAKYILETYGYKIGKVTEAYSDSVPPGIVISQKPDKGSVLADGGTVSVVVSLGPEFGELDVIDLRGMTLEAATAAIEKMGLSLGAINYIENATVVKDCVISHSPGPGTLVKEPIEVDLVISKGPGLTDPVNPPDPTEPVNPNSVSLVLDFSLATNEEFLLTINVADGVNAPRTPISKQARSKANSTETVSVSGAGRNGTVKVWYDNDLVYDLNVDFVSGEIQ